MSFKIAVTGHRAERIRLYARDIEYWLNSQFKNLKEVYGDVILIDGMADGVDQMAAFTALKCGVPVHCYFAFRKKLNRAQTYIADNAAEIRYVNEEYWDGCFLERDHRMVDDCDLLLVVWDGKPYGGAYLTYQYALEEGKNILIYPGYKGKLV